MHFTGSEVTVTRSTGNPPIDAQQQIVRFNSYYYIIISINRYINYHYCYVLRIIK